MARSIFLASAVSLLAACSGPAAPGESGAGTQGTSSPEQTSSLGQTPSLGGTSSLGQTSTSGQATSGQGQAPDPLARRDIVLLAGGDVSFGRDLGQTLLREPAHDFFKAVAPLFAKADVRFVNLESQLSDQKGETQSPWVKLVFTGPPAGAGALARAGVDVVSLANNHAWDYGRKALFETLDHLDRAGVAHAGTGRTRADAYAPAIVERGGFRVAILAVTDIWNQGLLRTHVAADYVARADKETLAAGVREARAREGIDAVLVSYHGGVEFLNLPIPRTRALLQAAIDAGADAVIGHHPHVAQGIEWYRGRPILYSLGNLVMQMSDGRGDGISGYLARLHLSRERSPEVEVCPLRFGGPLGKPLVGHSGRALLEKRFFGRLERISKTLGGIAIGETGEDGCAPVRAAEPASVPVAAAPPRRAD